MGKVETHPASSLQHLSKVGHDRLSKDRHTGWMSLRLSTMDHESLGVIPGSGSVALYEVQGEKHTVESCVRRRGEAIIPGTSIKGSIRALYEFLTGSCNITDLRSRCRGLNLNDKVCPACSLFGHMGYAGRVGFDDAVPDGEVHVLVTEVPVAWGPKRSSAAFRFYDGKPALGPEGAEPRDFVPVELYRGRFRCRVRFRNVSGVELGRLLLALGQGDGALAFMPKLGAKKFDGQGAVGVEVLEVSLAEPGKLGPRSTMSGESVKSFVSEQIEAAKRDKSWQWNQVQEQLSTLAASLKEGYE